MYHHVPHVSSTHHNCAIHHHLPIAYLGPLCLTHLQCHGKPWKQARILFLLPSRPGAHVFIHPHMIACHITIPSPVVDLSSGPSTIHPTMDIKQLQSIWASYALLFSFYFYLHPSHSCMPALSPSPSVTNDFASLFVAPYPQANIQ